MKNFNLLFLDDDRRRAVYLIDRLTQEAPNIIVTWVETAQAAIDLLKKEAFHIISLDHDLGGKTYQDSNEANCGMTVAKYLAAQKLTTVPIIVHSYNAKAAAKMVEVMSLYVPFYVPFSDETVNIIKSFANKNLGN
jgi:CheY-like chemotaxis protein